MSTNSVPNIKGVPFLGNLPEFSKQPFVFPHEIAPKYGRVVQLKLGPRDLYVIWHPDDIQKVLRDNHRNYVKGNTAYPLEVISGPALVNMEGENWLARRKNMQPYFHRKRVMGMLELMQAAIDEQFAPLDQMVNKGESIDLIAMFRRLTAHVFTRSFYGISLNGDEAEAMSQTLYTLLSYVWQRYITFSFIPEWIPYPKKGKFVAARQFLHEKSRELIQRRRNLPDGDDLLAMMMGLGDGDTSSFSDEALLQETVSLFQGGFDTSSGTLGWVFYALSQYPAVAERLQAEVDSVLSSPLSVGEMAAKLTYTHHVIQETMRLYPSAPAVVRLVVADDELGGYRIPANSTVMVSFCAVHRHPDFWDEPNEFKPERFADGEHQAYKHTFAYIPFASGPRMCIGDQFALYEMRLTIASLLRRYRFTLDSNYTLDPSTNSTYFPKQLPMSIALRQALS